MKKIMFAAIAALALVGTAQADVGVGFDGSLGGVNGLSVIYTPNGKIALQGIGNVHAQHSDTGDSTVVNWASAVRGWYTFASNGTVNGNIGVGTSFGQSNGDWRNAAIEIPFGVDMFLNKQFSVSLQVGPEFTFGKDWSADLGGVNSFTGDLSVHYWFQ